MQTAVVVVVVARTLHDVPRTMAHFSPAACLSQADTVQCPLTDRDIDTVSQARTQVAQTRVELTGPKAVTLPAPGYALGEVIGQGGMGEVLVAQDQRIGREVAIKRIRSLEPAAAEVTRFLREARIQARLDHPAIVPVHELGTDGDGRPYFTMKLLTGVTLADKLHAEPPVQRMLRAFVDVCLAIEYAHARGVVHRDLKPSNIMLGDYGEVYVLDWGVATILDQRKRDSGRLTVPSLDGSTLAGAMVGTPGYMAPEQVRGEEASTKADVYALGAILFEILIGEPLHPRGQAALASTLSAPQLAPAQRATKRSIAPELDSACFDALAEAPDERPTARQLAEQVQAYLDGDRDIERRRELAAEQLVSAQQALASGTDDARSTAMRRAGRALALDPQSHQAAELVSTLLLVAPDRAQTPAALVEYLAAEERMVSASRSRQGTWAFVAMFLFSLLTPLFIHVKSWGATLGFSGLVALAALVSWRNAQRGRSSLAVMFVVLSAVVLMFTRFTGPFIVTPIVMCGCLMQWAAMRSVNKRLWFVLLWAIVTVMLPFVLEWTGLIDATYAVQGGVLLTRSDVLDLRGAAGEAALVVTNGVFLVAAAVVAVYLGRTRLAAQRQVQLQAWHLRQLLPAQRPASAVNVMAASWS